MLSFSLVAETLTGLIYHRPSGENSKFLPYKSESHSHKGCPNKEARKPKCASCKGPHVASYKGCPEYKKQAFRQHVVNKQKSYAAAVGQKFLPNPNHLRHFNL